METIYNCLLQAIFEYYSPFGIISGKENYIQLVKENEEKFLNYNFHIQDQLFSTQVVCVRYTCTQKDFSLDVSEWYNFEDNLIHKVYAYYHIGAVRSDRQLKNA